MKISTPVRYFRNVILIMTVLLFSNWSNGQLTELSASNISTINPNVTDPSVDNPDYDFQKHFRYTHVGASNKNTSTEVIQSNNNEKFGSAASLNKATSACFIPLDASYNVLPRNDDGSFGPIALPFTFDLYGASYTQVWINTNGNLTFTGPYSPFTASGFPFSEPMVAPFWGDVDTRNLAGGQIHYKVSATNLIVTWDNVGYYSQAVDKLNEFQVVISDGLDPIVGLGQNVCFNYGDMQWTTGSASSGVNGFGGTPATIGSNKGNGVDFYQLGRFGINSSVYDGPGGNTDGINYLDQQCYCAQTASAQNIAPIANNFPSTTINVPCGDTFNLDFSFIPPEVNQTVSSTVNVNGACGTTFTSTTGSLSNINFSLIGQSCNEGTNVITFTGTDDGTPVESTTVTLTIVVGSCCDLTASSTGQDESCANQSDGSIAVSTTGGTAPLQYSTDGGVTYSSSSNITGLATGTYVVLVKDANGCESVPQSITISGPTQLIASFSVTSILCSGGSANVTVSATGGTAPYTGTGSFSETAGSHSYTVTDANGCTSVTTVLIAEPTQLVATISATSILCNGGSADITVSATGGTAPYTGTGSFSETAGMHTYTVTDANGCSVDVSISISEPTTLVASSSAASILCNGGSADITVSATGGTVPYIGIGTFSETAGSYTYTVTDANGCTSSTSVTVSEPTQITATISATSILCNGGAADVTVTAMGGTSPYTGDGTFSETAGMYTYTVTDANGCSVDISITISEPTTLVALSSAASILCNGGSADVTVTATGGTAPYSGIGIFSETAGSYTYTVTDANGCTSSTLVSITEPTALIAHASCPVIDCFGGTADLAVFAFGGTLPYTGEGIFNVPAGTYTYTVTDANGCTSDVTHTVDQPDEIEANITPQNHVIDCIPIPVTLTANPTGGTGGPYTYLWSTGETTSSIEVNPNTTSTYTVEITDANGCTANAATNGTTVSVLNRCGNNNQKVVICHVPSGNNQNPQTICISPNALNPHLSNLWNLHGGDYCGPCQTSSSLAIGNTNEGDNLFIRAGINMNNESIELSYRIGYDSKVRLEIYDMAGTLVDVVHTAQANEGELYNFKVNTDKISSGVYIYQFITDSETHIDKLQIIQ